MRRSKLPPSAGEQIVSAMFAALNPNISSEQLVEMIQRETDYKVEAINRMGESLIKDLREIKDPWRRNEVITLNLQLMIRIAFI